MQFWLRYLTSSPPQDTDCSICMEKISKDFILTKCNHYFHKVCLEQWEARSIQCPYCRSSLITGKSLTREEQDRQRRNFTPQEFTTTHIEINAFIPVNNRFQTNNRVRQNFIPPHFISQENSRRIEMNAFRPVIRI